MLDLTKYLLDANMIDFYSQNFTEEELVEFLAYCNKCGMNREDIRELLMDYILFIDSWGRWQEVRN